MIQLIKRIIGIGHKTNFGELLANGALVVDVRTKGEFASGHLPKSINIPLNELTDHISKITKTKPVILCCASGMRSSSAAAILRSHGFKEVYNGGSWINLKKYSS